MIFHLTQKLAKKIKLHPLNALRATVNPFIDWTAHFFTVEHIQYIIITNSYSLYSMVMYGHGITDHNKFIKSTLNFMRELMINDGCDFIYRRQIVPYSAQISFAKATNKPVLGSMNELIFESKFFIGERRLSVLETSFEINNALMKYINYKSPLETFRKLKEAEKNS